MMLYGELRDFGGAVDVSPALRKAVVFLLEKAAGMPDGRHDIGDGIFAEIKNYNPAPAESRPYEAHVTYADVQCVLEGEETIYFRPLDGMERSESHPDRDLYFYKEPERGLEMAVTMRPGYFLMLMPKDGHKTECLAGAAKARKVIMKVPADQLPFS